MTCHPFFLRLLLTLLLLGSQQMGLAHSIAHLTDADKGRSESRLQSKQLPSDKVCQQCMAFAQVDAGVNTPPFAFIALSLEKSLPLAGLASSAPAVTCCPFLSRAPPASF